MYVYTKQYLILEKFLLREMIVISCKLLILIIHIHQIIKRTRDKTLEYTINYIKSSFNNQRNDAFNTHFEI